MTGTGVFFPAGLQQTLATGSKAGANAAPDRGAASTSSRRHRRGSADSQGSSGAKDSHRTSLDSTSSHCSARTSATPGTRRSPWGDGDQPSPTPAGDDRVVAPPTACTHGTAAHSPVPAGPSAGQQVAAGAPVCAQLAVTHELAVAAAFMSPAAAGLGCELQFDAAALQPQPQPQAQAGLHALCFAALPQGGSCSPAPSVAPSLVLQGDDYSSMCSSVQQLSGGALESLQQLDASGAYQAGAQDMTLAMVLQQQQQQQQDASLPAALSSDGQLLQQQLAMQDAASLTARRMSLDEAALAARRHMQLPYHHQPAACAGPAVDVRPRRGSWVAGTAGSGPWVTGAASSSGLGGGLLDFHTVGLQGSSLDARLLPLGPHQQQQQQQQQQQAGAWLAAPAGASAFASDAAAAAAARLSSVCAGGSDDAVIQALDDEISAYTQTLLHLVNKSQAAATGRRRSLQLGAGGAPRPTPLGGMASGLNGAAGVSAQLFAAAVPLAHGGLCAPQQLAAPVAAAAAASCAFAAAAGPPTAFQQQQHQAWGAVTAAAGMPGPCYAAMPQLAQQQQQQLVAIPGHRF